MREGRVLRQIADPKAGANFIVDPPICVEDSEKAEPQLPLELGQHTKEVLHEIGYDEA